MLGGIDPVIIFNFPVRLENSLFFATEGIPTEPPTFLEGIGIPIPLYLSEHLTGLYVQSESKSIDIETESYAKNDKTKKMLTIQKTLNNSVNVTLIGKRDSILLGVLLSLSDIIFTAVAAKEYSVSYFNGPTTVFGGLLTGFSTSTDPNTDLMTINITFWKTVQLAVVPGDLEPVQKTTGTKPLAGGGT